MNRNWNYFLIVWIIVIAMGPVTLLLNFPLDKIFATQTSTISFFQRLVGLLLFSLIFTQIVIGSNMPKFIELFSGKIFRFHVVEGIVAYSLMILHPILGSLNGVSLLPVFVRYELLYNLGRFAFVLFTLAVFAALLRTQPFLTRHWRKFHILNYVAFYLIAIHSYFVGSDTKSLPFVIFWWMAVVVITLLIIKKLLRLSNTSARQS